MIDADLPAGRPALTDFIPLNAAAELLPRRDGKKISYRTLWRWATRGVRGHRLWTIIIGARRYTTPAAVADFIELQTSLRTGPALQPEPARAAARARSIASDRRDAADRAFLAAAGALEETTA